LTEPPKPITQLAEPIDRAGPRRMNDVGGFAVVVTVVAAGTIAWAMGTHAQTLTLLSFVFAPAGLVLGIIGLVRASNRHLRRATAMVAVILSAALLLLWAASLILFLPGR